MKSFFESIYETLSEERLLHISQHLQHSFREYFHDPDSNNDWIRDQFSVNIYEFQGLAVVEKEKLIEISTNTALKLYFHKTTLPNL